jgi:hypothetical protein
MSIEVKAAPPLPLPSSPSVLSSPTKAIGGGGGGGGGTYIYLQLSSSSISLLSEWMRVNGIPNALSSHDLHITLVNSDRTIKVREQKLSAPTEAISVPSSTSKSTNNSSNINNVSDGNDNGNVYELARYSEDEPLMIYHYTYSLSVWKTRHNTNCLVLNMSNDILTQRHMDARTCGASHAFDIWECHLTLSYDIDNLTAPSSLPPSTATSAKKESTRSPRAATAAASSSSIADRIRRKQLKAPQFDIGIIAELSRPRVENWALGR